MSDGTGHRSADEPVLAALSQIDRLRGEGLRPEQIAAAMGAARAVVPGGGTWSPAKVDRILQVFDSVRSEAGAAVSAVAAPPRAVPRPPSPPERPRTAEPSPTTSRPTASHPTTSRTPPPRTPPRQVPLRPVEAAPRQAAAPAPADPRSGSGRRPMGAVRWGAIGLALAGVGAGGFLAIDTIVGRSASTSSAVDGDATTTTAGPSSTSGSETTVTTLSPGPADTMVIRIETIDPSGVAAEGDVAAATATIRKDGKLYLEGAFASQADADAFLERAGAIFGAENIVEDYVIDPAAPAPTVGDVALDKPVLFQPGTVEIDPAYIPFLEACAGVLALNPEIVMSISAYTDSLGPEDFNLELSQQRAQAIVDFYRSRDIGDGQLVGNGFGEAEPVADNGTEAGRSQNRRAMLQLLNVMGDDGQEP